MTNTLWQRGGRILLWIAIMYALWNPFYPWNVVDGLIVVLGETKEISDETYRYVAIAASAVVIIFLFAFLYRRLRLVFENRHIWVLIFQTLGLVIIIGILAVVAGKQWATGGQFAPADYIKIFSWTWQIPVGYFIGAGLNWAARTFQIAGQRAVLPGDTGDHHHHGQ